MTSTTERVGRRRADPPRRSPTSRPRPGSRCRPCPRSSTGARTSRRRPVAGSRRRSGSTATSAPPGPAAERPCSRSSSTNSSGSGRWRSSAGVERVAGRHQLAVDPVRDAGPPDTRPRLDRGGPDPPADGRHRGLLRPERDDARPAADARHPVRRRRPDRRAAPRHAVGRGDELERRADRDAPPAGPGTSADRGHRRARRASCAAAPGSMAIGPRWTRPACPSIRALISYGHFHVDEGIEKGRALLAPARSADGHLRRQRPPGARRLPGGARDAPPHPGGPQRRRLRRPAGRALGRAAADDRAPAAHRDGRDGRRDGPGLARGEVPPQTRVELTTELVVRESTAPPPG